MKKKWLVSCRFGKKADAKRYYLIAEAKSYEKALKKVKKAIKWGQRTVKARGFAVYPMYSMPGKNDDVWYIYSKEV